MLRRQRVIVLSCSLLGRAVVIGASAIAIAMGGAASGDSPTLSTGLGALSANIAVLPAGACDFLQSLSQTGVAITRGLGQMNDAIYAMQVRNAQEHLGVQVFNGESFGLGAVAPITQPVIKASARFDYRPLTREELEILSSQLVGQAKIDLARDDLVVASEQAEAEVLRRANAPGWTNGDPYSTFWGGVAPRLASQLVGRLIAGFEVIGPHVTFYAGKVRRVFAVGNEGGQRLHQYAELEVPGGKVVTVPLESTGKDITFAIYGEALPRNWFE